jgi:hypothetical protein
LVAVCPAPDEPAWAITNLVVPYWGNQSEGVIGGETPLRERDVFLRESEWFALLVLIV